MLSTIVLIALLLRWAAAQVAMSDLNNVTMAFSSAQIVPDVLPSFNPVDLVNLTFTDSVTMESVDVVPGILLTMEQTALQPDISLIFSDTTNSTGNMSFVVALLDPDAPTTQDPGQGQFLQFLGGDFTADPTSGLLSNSSPALMDFVAPAPLAGSDPQRYILLVYNQPDTFDIDGPTFVNTTTPGSNFSISDFAQDVDLGDPIAGNYFLVGPADNSSSSTTQILSTTDQQPSPTAPFFTNSLAPTNFSTSPSAVVTAPSTATSSTSRGISNKMRLCTLELIAITVAVIYVTL